MKKYQFQLPAIPFYVPELLDRLVIAIVLRYRKIRFGCAFRRIKLTPGKYGKKYTLVDPEDYGELARYKWFAVNGTHTFYARRNTKVKSKEMHRYIMNNPIGFAIDHINHNGLDNRRANLRLATPAQNSRNRKKQAGKYSSIYKGVYRDKGTNRWRSAVYHNNKCFQLGRFDNETDAAKAYDKAAKELFKDFASLNFKNDG